MSIIIRDLAGCIDLLKIAAAFPERYPCLLESVAMGTAQTRYDILFAFPQSVLRLDTQGIVSDAEGKPLSKNFLDALDTDWQQVSSQQQNQESALPFSGGWVVYLGYELAQQIEPKLKLPDAPIQNMPVALALRCPAAIVVDHVQKNTLLIAETAYAHLLQDMANDLASAPAFIATEFAVGTAEEDAPEYYLTGIQRIHDYLRAGDIFQVNLSREWKINLDQSPITPAQLYAALRITNPAPFAGLLQWEDWAIVSSSPERLVEVRGDCVQTRPIAGTRPRFAGDDDKARQDELVGHPKERAEHVMLIDLERNDLGRVCVPGSIKVNEMMVVETYAHVHHIVSNVQGRLRENITPGQVISAVFPGGTITGCPKVRCMEIIAELERVGRGAYTGSLGYLNRNGDLDLNILIRTMTLHAVVARLRTGAGIVVDSQAQRELEETRAKARGVLRALGIAG